MNPSRATASTAPDPPGCAVAYADNDPLVLVYARALLTSQPQGRCGYIDADLRDPAAVLAQASATLDLTKPVAALLLAVLHFLPAADEPARIVADLARALAPGSYLAVSHLTADFAPAQVGAAVAAYNAAVPSGVITRSHAEVTALLGGLPLVPPGVVPVTEWRPDTPASPAAPAADLYAGIARTPPHACASTTRLGVLIG
jgi:S-adenosyl methyltransferase